LVVPARPEPADVPDPVTCDTKTEAATIATRVADPRPMTTPFLDLRRWIVATM